MSKIFGLAMVAFLFIAVIFTLVVMAKQGDVTLLIKLNLVIDGDKNIGYIPISQLGGTSSTISANISFSGIKNAINIPYSKGSKGIITINGNPIDLNTIK